MRYTVERNTSYDFINEAYASKYPNLHKYPATMLPQIGIKILKDFDAKGERLLDPYCGSGSSFSSALESDFQEIHGFDINPLAVLISQAKFTIVDLAKLEREKEKLRNNVFEFMKKEKNIKSLSSPDVTNIDYWFSFGVTQNINVIKHFISKIRDKKIKNLFTVPLSETIRDCSYTRNNEFKLYRMKPEDILSFNPDVLGIFFKKLDDVIEIYQEKYYPKLSKLNKVNIQCKSFSKKEEFFDTVLTSPPYGDSKTTVAYGQFSTLSNEWLGIDYARKVDGMLMGGQRAKTLYKQGLTHNYLLEINNLDEKRALEVSAFYQDLEKSISNVANSIKKGGKAFYVVGNRTVKGIKLPTDQFIAEKFEQNGFKHLVTYERALSSKSMPLRNSPTNKRGKTVNTMLFEYIVACEKTN